MTDTHWRLTRRAWLAGSASLAFAARAGAAAGPEVVTLPRPYVPGKQVSGRLRIWGHGAYGNRVDFIERLVRAWESGFRAFHPQFELDVRLYGTASAIGALYTGTGDLALMGREIWPNEIAGFREVLGYDPTGLDVVTGSFDVRNRGYALVAFVHRDNPLRSLALDDLARVFGAALPEGRRTARLWGDLGLRGAWRERPINVYGLPIARGFAEYFEDRVFRGGHRWNPALREFADLPGSTGGATDGGQRMLDAMAEDPASIGYAGLVYHHERVRPLALAEHRGLAPVRPTLQSVRDHSYPLTRMITMYLNRQPGVAVEPAKYEFLRYALSEQGQQAVIDAGQGYLPMLRPFAERELAKLA